MQEVDGRQEAATAAAAAGQQPAIQGVDGVVVDGPKPRPGTAATTTLIARRKGGGVVDADGGERAGAAAAAAVVLRARAVERRLEGLLAVEVAAERLRIMAETLGHQTAAGNLRLKLELHVRIGLLFLCVCRKAPSE